VHPRPAGLAHRADGGRRGHPGAALAEGIQWSWESFPDYLDAVERAQKALDVGAQVPHGAVRAHVMGERGARSEAATPSDIQAMAALVREGVAAGALGFSTSRTIAPRPIDGEPVPGMYAAEDELVGIGRVLGELRTAVFELAGAGALVRISLPPSARWRGCGASRLSRGGP